MKIYVATSWRNELQPFLVEALKADGYEVYDFHHPADDSVFHWRDIDPDWRLWTPEQCRISLGHPLVEAGYAADFNALEWADVIILVTPCGLSSGLEAGYAKGNRKPIGVLMGDGDPELMLNMADGLFITIDEVLTWLRGVRA